MCVEVSVGEEQHWKEHIFRLNSTLPKIFWHSSPPSEALQNIFIEVTRERGGGGERGLV